MGFFYDFTANQFREANESARKINFYCGRIMAVSKRMKKKEREKKKRERKEKVRREMKSKRKVGRKMQII